MKYLVSILLSIGILIKLNAQDLDNLVGEYINLGYQLESSDGFKIMKNSKFEYRVSSGQGSKAYKGSFIIKKVLNDILLVFKPDTIDEYSYNYEIINSELVESKSLSVIRPYNCNDTYDSLGMRNRTFLLAYPNSNAPLLISLDTLIFGTFHIIDFAECVNSINIMNKLAYGYLKEKDSNSTFQNKDITRNLFSNGKANDFIFKKLITAKVIEQIKFKPQISFTTDDYDSCLYYIIDKGVNDGIFVGMKLVKELDGGDNFDKQNNYHSIMVTNVYENFSIVERKLSKVMKIAESDNNDYRNYFASLKRQNINFEGLIFKNSFWLK